MAAGPGQDSGRGGSGKGSPRVGAWDEGKAFLEECLGHVWTGDCLDFMAQLPSGCVDAIITDPPYPGRADIGGGPGRLAQWLAPMPRLSRIALVKWSSAGLPEACAAVPLEWKLLHVAAWHKQFVHGRLWTLKLHPHWEPVLIYGDGYERRGERHWSDSVSSNIAKYLEGATGHVAQEPEVVAAWLIRGWTQPGDVILDPFLGSGTVAVVAERLGRRWIGCEISSTYADMARRRILRAREQGILPLAEPALHSLQLGMADD